MKVLDIFSGIGGFTLGLQAAGMTTMAFAECEDYAQKVLRKNFPNIPIFNDVAEITSQTVGTRPDLICGGFPCQDISVGGKRQGIEKGERSALWYEYLRIVEDVRPKYAVIENVAGLLSLGLDVVLTSLAQIGYDACWTTLDSQFCGVPQRRRRVYILAVRDGIPANADIFGFSERDNERTRQEMDTIRESRPWCFEKGDRIGQPFAYATRQRADEFATTGVASTLSKRDYKMFTDLIVTDDRVRWVTPRERLLLQGFPEDFFDGLGLNKTQMFMLNGMTVPAVKWIGERIMAFDTQYG